MIWAVLFRRTLAGWHDDNRLPVPPTNSCGRFTVECPRYCGTRITPHGSIPLSPPTKLQALIATRDWEEMQSDAIPKLKSDIRRRGDSSLPLFRGPLVELADRRSLQVPQQLRRIILWINRCRRNAQPHLPVDPVPMSSLLLLEQHRRVLVRATGFADPIPRGYSADSDCRRSADG